MESRGHPIPVGTWWLNLARGLIESDERDLTRLGEDLAKRVGRADPFSHSQLSRFRSGKIGATLELAEALCAEFTRLPRPVFFPQSYEEAVHHSSVVDRYARGAEDRAEPAAVVALPKPGERAPRRKRATDAPSVGAIASSLPALKRRSRG
jgi:hypothetical protein